MWANLNLKKVANKRNVVAEIDLPRREKLKVC